MYVVVSGECAVMCTDHPMYGNEWFLSNGAAFKLPLCLDRAECDSEVST